MSLISKIMKGEMISECLSNSKQKPQLISIVVLFLLFLFPLPSICSDGNENISFFELPDSVNLSEIRVVHCPIGNISFLDERKLELYIFNTNNSKPEYVVNLIGAFSQSDDRLDGITVHNKDTIIVSSYKWVKLIDNNGNLLSKHVLNKIGKKLLLSEFCTYFPLMYDNTNHTVYIQNISTECFNKDKGCCDFPLETGINLKTGKTDLIRAYKPKTIYLAKLRYESGYARTIVGDKHIYSFLTEPELYVYNRTTGENQIFDLKSSHQGLNIREIDLPDDEYKKLYEIIRIAPFYTNIVYNKAENQFYREFSKEQASKDESGLLNLYSGKKKYLQVISSKFKLLKEIALDKQTYNDMVPDNGGVWVNYAQPGVSRDNKIYFQFIKTTDK